MSTQAVLTLLGLKASQELKNLLENKHLYQHVSIDAGEILKQQVEAEPNLKSFLGTWATKELPKMRFVLTPQPVQIQNTLTLVLPNVSLFCRHCGRREAFAPIWSNDVGSPIFYENLMLQTLPSLVSTLGPDAAAREIAKLLAYLRG